MSSTALGSFQGRSARAGRTGRQGAPGTGVLALAVTLLSGTGLLGWFVLASPGHPPFQSVDERWLALMAGPHSGLYAAGALVLDLFGGPFGAIVPLALLVLLGIRRRWWSVCYVLTTYLGASTLVVQVLKHVVDRPRPADPLVRVDHGSFPSGHVAGTAMLVVIAGVLLVPVARRRLWWLAGSLFTVAMIWSRTWLHAHWLTDTMAGAMAGAGAALLLWWLFGSRLSRECRA